MGEHAEALRKRIGDFTAGVLQFVRSLPTDVATDSVIRQVARSAAGCSANYREACSARSYLELTSKLGAAVDDSEEAGHWLWMAKQLGLGDEPQLNRLMQQARELRHGLSASLSTARQHRTPAGDGAARPPVPRPFRPRSSQS
jgi:four helix bundle protein